MPSKRRWVAYGVAGVLGLGFVGSLMDPSASKEAATSTATSTATATASPSPPTTGTPAGGPGGTATSAPTATTSTPPAEAAVPVTGVSDGDTIKVDVDGSTERVRLIGIDTPELQGDQCYAQEAAGMMRSLAQPGSVRLEADPGQEDRDRYGRLLRHVFLEDGRNAAEVMIAGGYGREYTYDEGYQYQAEYRAAEDRAQEGGDGLWGACGESDTADRTSAQPDSQADISAPATERALEQVAPAAPEGPASGSCEIKGNINSEGEKIYHVPGGRSYAKTSIDEGEGERWFCSAAEAEGAGWRAARG